MLIIRITDSTGTPQYSSPVVIQAGSSDACLNASASSVSTGAITTTGDSSSTESYVYLSFRMTNARC